MYKFCKNCAFYTRKETLKRHHLAHCQPLLKAYEDGFVEVGKLPVLNHDEFKAKLALLTGEKILESVNSCMTPIGDEMDDACSASQSPLKTSLKYICQKKAKSS